MKIQLEVGRLGLHIESSLLGLFRGGGSLFIAGLIWVDLRRSDATNLSPWFIWQRAAGGEKSWDIWFGRWNLQASFGSVVKP